jgi:undecaprenyl-phosphate 4-deoxy-4-formamido-L-arabinose transferase
MITGYSVLPLRLASLLALLFMVFGFGVLVFVIGRTLIQGVAVPGFAMISSLIAILSGVQLFSLGILGEYLARMHVRMMDSPPYAIRSTVP